MCKLHLPFSLCTMCTITNPCYFLHQWTGTIIGAQMTKYLWWTVHSLWHDNLLHWGTSAFFSSTICVNYLLFIRFWPHEYWPQEWYFSTTHIIYGKQGSIFTSTFYYLEILNLKIFHADCVFFHMTNTSILFTFRS